MSTIPPTVVNYREAGATSWETAAGGQFQATDGVQYEICCVGPSEIRTVSWDFETFMVSDGAGGFEVFQVSDGEGGHEDLEVVK